MKMNVVFYLLLSWTLAFTISCTPQMSLDPNSVYTDAKNQFSLGNSDMTLDEAQSFLDQLKLEFFTKEDIDADFAIISAKHVEKLGSWQVKIIKNPVGKLTRGSSPGSYRYEPPTDFNGTTSFEIALFLNNQQTKSVSGKINVESVIESGQANDVKLTLLEDTKLNGFTLNFTNPDNLQITTAFNDNQVLFTENDTQKDRQLLDPATGKVLGKLSSAGSNKFNFEPVANLNGDFEFNYQISYYSNGNFVASSQAKVRLSITPVHDTPTINTFAFNALKNKVFTLELSTITSDLDGFGLNFSVVSANHGSAIIENGNSLKFTPETNHVSTATNFASVVLKVRGKNSGLEATGNLKINVLETNQNPVISIGTTIYTLNEDQVFNFEFTAMDPDNDTLTMSVQNTSDRGQSVGTSKITKKAENKYQLTFTPLVNFYGKVTLEIGAFDGIVKTTKSLIVTYNEVSDPLIINTTPYTLSENTNHQVNLKDIVSVPDADAMMLYDTSTTASLTAQAHRDARISGVLNVKTAPSNGSFAILNSGSARILKYTPSKRFHGNDSVVLELTDTESTQKYTVNLGYTIKAVVPALSLLSSSFTFTQNTAINEVLFSNNGGGIDSCSIDPTLPSGLVLNTLNCGISGTPMETSDLQQYTILAHNDGGTADAKISISVIAAKPNLSASITDILGTVGKLLDASSVGAISSDSPIETCQISPELPAGVYLNLVDRSSCVISGTPTQELVHTVFTVKASNSGGYGTIAITMTIDPSSENLTKISLKKYLKSSELAKATQFVDELDSSISYLPIDACARELQTKKTIEWSNCEKGPSNGTRLYSQYSNNKTYVKKGDSRQVIALRTRTEIIYSKSLQDWLPWAEQSYQEIVEYDREPLGNNLKVISSYKCSEPNVCGLKGNKEGFKSLIQNEDGSFVVLWNASQRGNSVQIINISVDGKLDQRPAETTNSIGSQFANSFYPNQLFRDKDGDYLVWYKENADSPSDEATRYIAKISPQNKLIWKGLAKDLWLTSFVQSYILTSGELALAGPPHSSTLGAALVGGGSTFGAVINSDPISFRLKGDFDGDGIITQYDLELGLAAVSNVTEYEDKFGHNNTVYIGDLNYDRTFDSNDTAILDKFLTSSSNGFMKGLEIVLQMNPKDLEF
ncbi:MAG: hypothetical protein JNL11_13360 [Bdellovibrionaceae bacterium]|nr:hypothetical protein [Pseudobdellovibrionaceae bacterium]